MRKNICIIGAGNIGSRHLQSLAKVSTPLSIQVIDPSAHSLALSQKRFEEVQTKFKHQVSYSQNLNQAANLIDIAIVATNSNIRFNVTKQLLNKSQVKYIIFEKILFDKKSDYSEMARLLSEKKVKAWVNCSRRSMPFYNNLKNYIKGKNIQYLVSGSNWGLGSNAIHLVDHISFLTGEINFAVDTTFLDKEIYESRRRGFMEIAGSLTLRFNDGSLGIFTNYKEGNAPQIMQILSENFRCLTLETERKSYTSSSDSNWKWKFGKTPMLNQSEMTNKIVSSLLTSGKCALTPFEQSVKLHLQLLDPLLKFINENSTKKYLNYPFT